MDWSGLALVVQGILSAEPACVELSVIHTASMVQREAVADEGGSWLKKRPMTIAAVGSAFLPLAMEPLGDVAPFAKGRDFLSDGSLLLIPVAGHTPGSLMLLAKGCDSRKWLFIGDEAWLGSAVRAARGKPWFVRWMADVEHGLLIEEIKRIAEMARRLDARVVPAHDLSAYEGLPEYPEFR